MTNEVVLSVVVPTLNRRALLETTLALIEAQLAELTVPVEFLVVDNASEDETAAYLRARHFCVPCRVVCYEERVDIDGSFRRCVELSSGRYINIFGDDDIPLPGFFQQIVNAIQGGEPPSIVYVNRLIGNEDLSVIEDIGHKNHGVVLWRLPSSDFIRTFTHHPGFITSLVFSRDCWQAGEELYSDVFLGWKFLARVYAGSQGSSCVFVGLPLLIQRRGVQSWKQHWPRYWLVNMPALLSELEAQQLTFGALSWWRAQEVGLQRLLVDCVVAKAFNYGPGDTFWSCAARFQPAGRALLMQCIRFALPGALARALYFRRGKYKVV